MSTTGEVQSFDAVDENADPKIRPQDDLFGHVNGQWLDTAEIPPDLPIAGAFVDLLLTAERQVADLLEDAAQRAADGRAAPGSEQQKIGDLFASFLDEERADRLGSTPLEADLAAIDEVSDVTGLLRLLGALERDGGAGLVAAHVDTDDRASNRYVVNLHQAGLGLPDESYYREDGFAEIRSAYVDHVGAMLRLLGRPTESVAAEAQRVMALESRLAASHWDRVACRDVVKTYNLMTFTDLQETAPAYDWAAWTTGLGAVDGTFAEVVVRQPSYLQALSQALVDVPLDDWKCWLRWHLVHDAAPYLSAPFVEENFAFYSRTLAGSEQLRERWKRGVALLDVALGQAVGRQYVAQHFPPESKAAMDDLVANLVEAYRRDIGRLEWMSPRTRERALEKLASFRPKIGYPERWRDYSTLEIRRDDLLGNVRRAAAFETARQLAKIGQPVDRDEWLMTPQTVNAYYNPGTNEICFPAAILRPPFFALEAHPADNYGGIGAVIGHEIGHGFDDQGSQYDGEGNLVDWWTADDRARFTERADKLIEQYDGLEPSDLPGHRVNGALTVGENIGDLGGLTVALQAYEISREDSPDADGTEDGRQRLFRNWARVWRSKRRPEYGVQLLAVDVHSPPEFRANIARNLDEFHETFGTGPDDGMWLEPADRVRIW